MLRRDCAKTRTSCSPERQRAALPTRRSGRRTRRPRATSVSNQSRNVGFSLPVLKPGSDLRDARRQPTDRPHDGLGCALRQKPVAKNENRLRTTFAETTSLEDRASEPSLTLVRASALRLSSRSRWPRSLHRSNRRGCARSVERSALHFLSARLWPKRPFRAGPSPAGRGPRPGPGVVRRGWP
jgi:hypothetical protein